MGTPFDAVGLSTGTPDEFNALFSGMQDRASWMGAVGDLTWTRWQDPSGLRVNFVTSPDGCEQITPTFDSGPGAYLRGLTVINDHVATAAVFDHSGEQCTALTLTLEDGILFPAGAGVDGRAVIIALAVDVQVFATEDEFQQSPASLLNPEDEHNPPRDPPPSIDGGPMNWPARVGTQSFFSYGVFYSPDEAGTDARIAGIVGDVSTRRIELTGQSIHVVRLKLDGFEVTACMSALEHPVAPRPGMVVAGYVQLTGYLDPQR